MLENASKSLGIDVTHPCNNGRHTASNARAACKQSNYNRSNRNPECNGVGDKHPCCGFFVDAESILDSSRNEILNSGSVQAPFNDGIENEFGLASRAKADHLLAINKVSTAKVPHVNIVKVGQVLVCDGIAEEILDVAVERTVSNIHVNF
jgi:hypothetical protein